MDASVDMAEHINIALPSETVLPSEILDLKDRPAVRKDICIAGCSKQGDFIRCCLCAKWYHTGCLKLPADETNGVRACITCRHVADEVSEIRMLTHKLIQDNSVMRDILVKQQEQIDKFVKLQTTTSGFLKEIESSVNDIKKGVLDKGDSDSDDEYDDPEGRVCYSDSLTRDCVPTKSDMKFERAGPYISNMRKTIKKLPARKIKQEILLVIGTNDLASRRPAEKIANECDLLVQEAMIRAEKVTLSSIPPRADGKVDPRKMDTVNEQFYHIADSNGIEFVDHDRNFKYRDGSVDKSMLLEGDLLHLSSKGTQKLIDNLGLDAKPAIGSGPTNRWKPKKTTPGSGLPPPPPPPPTHPPQSSWSSSGQSGPSTPNTGRKRPWPGVRNLPHTKKKRYFKSERDPLSNFYLVQLLVWGKVFKSLEHAYQWRKAVFLGLDNVAWRIMQVSTAREAKRIADRELNTRGTDWCYWKKEIMYELLLVKVNQCPQMRNDLLQSGEEELIEDTQNEYWARGSSGQGLNMLGFLLMTIRDELLNGTDLTTLESYRPPLSDVDHPCFQCGEGNHNRDTCRHHDSLQCRQCSFTGHKMKHCPDLN
jgi:ribA/ribD-fused uncharacterized protein